MKSVENTCNETEGKRLYGDTVCRKLSWLTNNLCLYNLLSSLVILITCTMLGGEQILQSSSLCSFLHPVTLVVLESKYFPVYFVHKNPTFSFE